MPGLTLTAHCEPAREVGGDYYDFLPIDEHTIGILIADVSGKGTSAALYMAELKGIVLSLSQRHRVAAGSADRSGPHHLPSSRQPQLHHRHLCWSSISAPDAARYARAGHCPLVYVPGPVRAAPRAADCWRRTVWCSACSWTRGGRSSGCSRK